MTTRITVAAFFAMITLVVAGWQIQLTPERFVVETESKLWVEGTSTLHDYRCDVGSFDGAFVSSDTGSPIATLTEASIRVPVAAMDCGSGQMNRRMTSALKANRHAEISYALERVEVVESAGTKTLKAVGRLTMAGATQQITMNLEGVQQADGRLRFQGQTALSMAAFGIDPPTAMLGAVRTGDQVTVHFDVAAAGSSALVGR
jgi:polyisoprenoid-binding protein YceI